MSNRPTSADLDEALMKQREEFAEAANKRQAEIDELRGVIAAQEKYIQQVEYTALLAENRWKAQNAYVIALESQAPENVAIALRTYKAESLLFEMDRLTKQTQLQLNEMHEQVKQMKMK